MKTWRYGQKSNRRRIVVELPGETQESDGSRLTQDEREVLRRALVPFIEWPRHWCYAVGAGHSLDLLADLANRGLIERYMPDSYEYRLTQAGRNELDGIDQTGASLK